MILKDILIEVYGVKKDGSLKAAAIKFCEKYDLNLEGENNVPKMVSALTHLSNPQKREKAVMLAISIMTGNYKNEKEQKEEGQQKQINTNFLAWRKMTYKQVCRIYHPDNKDSGNENIFKFIQAVKYAFWDSEGNPREEITYWDWADEKCADTDEWYPF